jgi:hypothetical protein
MKDGHRALTARPVRMGGAVSIVLGILVCVISMFLSGWAAFGVSATKCFRTPDPLWAGAHLTALILLIGLLALLGTVLTAMPERPRSALLVGLIVWSSVIGAIGLLWSAFTLLLWDAAQGMNGHSVRAGSMMIEAVVYTATWVAPPGGVLAASSRWARRSPKSHAETSIVGFFAGGSVVVVALTILLGTRQLVC